MTWFPCLTHIFSRNGLTLNLGLISLLGILLGFYTQSDKSYLYNLVSGRSSSELEDVAASLWGADLWRVTINKNDTLAEHFAKFLHETDEISEQQKAPLLIKMLFLDKNYFHSNKLLTPVSRLHLHTAKWMC